MVDGFYGRKIGMTQLFSENQVIPVTIIDTSSWYVTDIKTQERDGYCAIQIAKVRKRYEEQSFLSEWLKKKKEFFLYVREVRVKAIPEGIAIGALADFYKLFSSGEKIDVTGVTKGCGFAGVMRRHQYSGGTKSHGNMMGRRPGSIGSLTKSGHVIKGKGLPGHMGVDNRTMKNLEVVKIMAEDNAIAIKGSVPGKAGSLVFVCKSVGYGG